MNKTKETVSGIITTYKREAYIVDRAIKSMIAQTYSLFEIIVVDDNDNDSSFCLELKTLCDQYELVKYIKQDGNKGACAARNLGIENAKGYFIAFLDDDDEWLPEKIEKQIGIFRKTDDRVGLVSVSGYLLNEDTNEKSYYFNYKMYKPSPSFQDMLSGDYVGSTSQPLIKAECFKKLGGFAVNQPARQDYEMWLRISRYYQIACSLELLFIHRMHDGEQISRNTKRAQQGYLNIYRWYKADYKKNPIAEQSIINLILANRGAECRLKYSGYYLVRTIDAIKLRLRKKAK